MAPLARVGDLAEQARGVTYGKEDASRTPTAGYLPVLRAGNITDTGLIFDDLVYVPAAKVSEKQKIKQGDIVIAASSGSLDSLTRLILIWLSQVFGYIRISQSMKRVNA